jgi:hypothetical protein
MTLKHQFDEDNWERVTAAWQAFWEGELERPLVVMSGARPNASRPRLPAYTAQFPPELSEDEVLDQYQADLEARAYFGDAFPKFKLTYGAGVVAAFLGARVRITSETIWFEPDSHTSASNLQPVYSPENEWWQRVQRMTSKAVERWGSQVTVACTDLGGNLDIIASLLGSQNLLYEMMDAPEEVDRLVRQVSSLWLAYYDCLDAITSRTGLGSTPWAPIWSPSRSYMLQCDLAYMISPIMFTRFVMPDLEECCQALDVAFYHMDGKGQIGHLDQLLSLETLDGIQWIPGEGQPPPEEWIPLLKRIRKAGKLCQVFVTPQGALKIARELGGKGFIFAIEQEMQQQEAEALFNALTTGRD